MTATWKARHYATRTRRVDPHPVAVLIDAIDEAVSSYPSEWWPDAFTTLT